MTEHGSASIHDPGIEEDVEFARAILEPRLGTERTDAIIGSRDRYLVEDPSFSVMAAIVVAGFLVKDAGILWLSSLLFLAGILTGLSCILFSVLRWRRRRRTRRFP